MPTKRTKSRVQNAKPRRGLGGRRTGSLGAAGAGRGSSRPSANRPRVRGTHSAGTGPSVGSRVGGAVAGLGSKIGQAGEHLQDRMKPKRGGFSTSYSAGRASASGFSAPAGRPTNPNRLDPDNRGFSPEAVLTRRNLMIGAAAIGGVAAVGGVGALALDQLEGSDDDKLTSITVAEDAVTGVDDLEQVATEDHVSAAGEYKLPHGTNVWADNDTFACCLVPGETASPLNVVRLLSLGSGNLTTVLEKAQSADEGYEIMDARCSEKGLVWTEVNVFENTWRTYTGKLNGASLSGIELADEGNADWLTPSIAAVGGRAFWQLVPNAEGDAADQHSVVKSVAFGGTEPETVLESKRAFSTRISPTQGGVVVTPRAEAKGTYFQLTLLDAKDGSVADQLTLPSNMRPDQAGYGRSGFSFSFNDTYNYGGGIANLGTYTPMREAVANDYDGLESWFRFGRTPSANPCWCGEWFCVKSTRAISGIHFATKKYFSIPPVASTDNWGEYLASTGICKHIVGLSQVTPSDGSKSYALVRVFTTKEGNLGKAFD